MTDDERRQMADLFGFQWVGPEMTEEEMKAWLKQDIFCIQPYVPLVITAYKPDHDKEPT